MTTSVPQKMVQWLFHDSETLSLGAGGWVDLIWSTTIRADKIFSSEFFNALQDKINTTTQNKQLSHEQKEIIYYNALAYLAFAHPQEGSNLNIDGETFTIHTIPLTSGWLSTPYYAYGLKSEHSSILIFQGTTVPSDRGFLAGILGDTMPGGAVGASLYRRGKNVLQLWIDNEYLRTGKPVLCTGQSLGGAMSMHCHIHQPEKVDFIAINPPTLTGREEQIYERNRSTYRETSERTLKVITHRSDPVFALGSHYLPIGTKIYHHGCTKMNALIAHTKAPNFIGYPLSASDTFVEYKSQKLRSLIWKIQKVFLFVAALLMQMISLLPRIIAKSAFHFFKFHRQLDPIITSLTYSTLSLITTGLIIGLLGIPTFGVLPLTLSAVVGGTLITAGSTLGLRLTAYVLGQRRKVKNAPTQLLSLPEKNNSSQSILNTLKQDTTNITKTAQTPTILESNAESRNSTAPFFSCSIYNGKNITQTLGKSTLRI